MLWARLSPGKIFLRKQDFAGMPGEKPGGGSPMRCSSGLPQTVNTVQDREKALLETIRQGLFLSSVNDASLGDRSRYFGLSEIAKYSECPRAAIAARAGVHTSNIQHLLAMQRGHWFEQDIRSCLEAAGLRSFHQLEINAGGKGHNLKAHLDFALVWIEPVKAVRILEIKSTEKLPDRPRDSHALQVQGQVDLLRHFWNRKVFSLRDETGRLLYENMAFPELCNQSLGLEIPTRAREVSVEGWILYLSMKDARAFGPYVYSPESLKFVKELASAFRDDMLKTAENPEHLDELAYPKGFYPLCDYCEYNAECPKFRQGNYQPEWEEAIQKLGELKDRQKQLGEKIRELEDGLKQAHSLSGTKDWIDTGQHRFRMSMVSGRLSLSQDALKTEIAGIFQSHKLALDIEEIFSRCMKQGASFPRMTISAIN